jgi:hypothetical protein
MTVKLSLCLIKHHAMKTYWGFLTSALDGGEWLASRPCRFTSGETAPGSRWVNPRACLDAMEKRQVCPCQESNPGRPARSPSLYCLSIEEIRIFKSEALDL